MEQQIAMSHLQGPVGIDPHASFRRAGLVVLSATAAAGAASCAIEFLRWRSLETLLATSFCGDVMPSAMALGQCSHCWGVAGTILGAVALAPWGECHPKRRSFTVTERSA
jgi:hypothetical protein